MEFEVTVLFAWTPVGAINIDAGSRIVFSRVDDGPAVYRFRFSRGIEEKQYIGEAENFSRRLQHYRTPGPTQRTNQRMNYEIVSALGDGWSVILDRVASGTIVRTDGIERPADTSSRRDRLLIECAALAIVGPGDALNL